jgi:hypothetical protein
VHYVKAILCYVLDRIKRGVTEERLYEIVYKSGVINYFYYIEALNELINNGTVSKASENGAVLLELEEKGRQSSGYFRDNIPFYFRKRLLVSAMSIQEREKRESEADVEIEKIPNGYNVTCRIKDKNFDLMRVSVYAPDKERAELFKSRLMINPVNIYNVTLSAILENKEPEIEIDAADI